MVVLFKEATMKGTCLTLGNGNQHPVHGARNEELKDAAVLNAQSRHSASEVNLTAKSQCKFHTTESRSPEATKRRARDLPGPFFHRSCAVRLRLGLLCFSLSQDAPQELPRAGAARPRRPRNLVHELHLPRQLIDGNLALTELDQLLLEGL